MRFYKVTESDKDFFRSNHAVQTYDYLIGLTKDELEEIANNGDTQFVQAQLKNAIENIAFNDDAVSFGTDTGRQDYLDEQYPPIMITDDNPEHKCEMEAK